MLENPFIIHTERIGNSSDPYVSKNETLKLDSNGKVVLSELPDEFQHVIVSGDNKVWYEIRTGLPNTNEYIVDYLQKTATFHISNAGKQLNFQYLGKGISYINVDNIYTALSNGSVVETLADIITNGQAGINALADVGNFKHVGIYSTGTTYKKFNIVYHKGASYLANLDTSADPETSTDWAKLVSRAWQGVYSTTITYQFGDSVVDSVNESIYVSIVNNNLNNPLTDTNSWFKAISVSDVITTANTAINNANTATQSATTAATNAQNLVNTYIHRGDYDSLINYVVNNEVRYQGSTWRCIQDCVGVTPVEGVNWTLVALKGVDGTGSVDSVNGMSGIVTLSATDVNAIPTTEKGATNGVATLGVDGKVPATQLNVQPPADASTTIKGIVMLEDSVTSTSVTTASTPNSVKTVNDKIGILTSLDNARQIENIGYGVQSGLNVTASTTPDMNIHVQAGTIYMPDGQRFNFATVTDLIVTVADATNPRKDIVYVSSTGVITYLAGTTSATPVEPTLPSGGFKLCTIDIPANDTAIEQVQIIDSRGQLKRTLAEQQRDLMINVKSFGAVGDGIIDDTIAIQDAINYVNLLGGGTVYFPRGTYKVKTLLMKDYVSLKGESGRFLSKLSYYDTAYGYVLDMRNVDLNMCEIDSLSFTTTRANRDAGGIIGGSTFIKYCSAHIRFKNLLFYSLDVGINGGGVTSTEDPSAIGIYDTKYEDIWCSDCNSGIVVGGSGSTIFNPIITGCNVGISLDYVSGESFAGGIMIGGVFASNNYDITLPKVGGTRPFAIVGTWFETSLYGIINIVNSNTRVMNLTFENCMLNTNSTAYTMLNFYNANGIITVKNCTISQHITNGNIDIAPPNDTTSKLTIENCQGYYVDGTKFIKSTNNYGNVVMNGTGNYNLVINHNLGASPRYVSITSNSADFTSANYYVDYVNGTEIVLSFKNPLTTGTNNIKFYWEAFI